MPRRAAHFLVLLSLLFWTTGAASFLHQLAHEAGDSHAALDHDAGLDDVHHDAVEPHAADSDGADHSSPAGESHSTSHHCETCAVLLHLTQSGFDLPPTAGALADELPPTLLPHPAPAVETGNLPLNWHDARGPPACT